MQLQKILKAVWNYLPAVFFAAMMLYLFFSMLIFYNDPNFGFSIFGPQVFSITIFPCIWLLIVFLGSKKQKMLEKRSNSQNNDKIDSGS